jgi:hypothetical protein
VEPGPRPEGKLRVSSPLLHLLPQLQTGLEVRVRARPVEIRPRACEPGPSRVDASQILVGHVRARR